MSQMILTFQAEFTLGKGMGVSYQFSESIMRFWFVLLRFPQLADYSHIGTVVVISVTASANRVDIPTAVRTGAHRCGT